MIDDRTGAGASDGFTLLVIDDDQIQRTIISRIGAQAGFKVTTVSSFEEASGLLQQLRFDCVTLDLGLGERSGALVMPIVAQLNYRLPVVIISGADDHMLKAAETMMHSLQIEGETFSKPLDLVKLRQKLAQLRMAAPVSRGLRKTA